MASIISLRAEIAALRILVHRLWVLHLSTVKKEESECLDRWMKDVLDDAEVLTGLGETSPDEPTALLKTLAFTFLDQDVEQIIETSKGESPKKPGTIYRNYNPH